jgi:flagellar motor switch protein FliN
MGAPDLGRFSTMPVEIEGQLDQTRIPMSAILELEPGSLLRLNRAAGENVDILAGGCVLGYGEVVVVENTACIRITDFHEER